MAGEQGGGGLRAELGPEAEAALRAQAPVAAASSRGAQGQEYVEPVVQRTQVGKFTLLAPNPIADSSPLVVLLGWAGASDKALAKYAELVGERGLPSVRSVLPTSALFSPTAGPRRRWALDLLAFLAALPRPLSSCPQGPRPLVLYSFSNGGGFVVEELQLLAEEGDPRAVELRERTAGFVFDSAPAYMHWYMGRRVLEAEAPPGLARSLRVAAFTAVALLGKALDPRRPERYWENMARLDWGRPFLFLYSRDDHLCDAAKLTELVAEKRSRAQNVRSHEWVESAHVSHYRLHPEPYRELLFSFLRSVSPNNGSGTSNGPGLRSRM